MIDVQLWEPINNIICMNELINLEIMLAPSTNYNQTLIEWRNRHTCMLVASSQGKRILLHLVKWEGFHGK